MTMEPLRSSSAPSRHVGSWSAIRVWWYPVGLCLVALAVIPLIGPDWISFYFYLMFWVVMAAAFNIIYGFTGYLPFGYVAFYGVGSYVTAIATVKLGVPVPVSVLLGGAVGVMVSLLFAPTLRLQGIYFAIVNLSLSMALMIVVSNLPEAWAGGSIGLSLAAVYKPTHSYYLMLVLLVASLWIANRVATSRLGIALRCIREDPEGAEVLGVDVVRSRLKAWMLAALLPSLAGGIDAWHTAIIDPQSAFDYLITVRTVVYAMFGGLGTVAGPMLGSISMYLLDDLIWSSFPRLNLLILGILVVTLVLFFPRGFLGTLLRRYPTLRRWIS
ncbi:MAG TPA: branched-chain amino acid ABC transporter permease [bacterium]|nr:branched-chain amino acid ABC transporter permease [bacterium]